MMKIICSTVILLVMTLASLKGRTQEIAVWKMADLQTAMDTASVPTILNFWATFCKPCIAELPYFQEAANRYQSKGVKLILVSLDLKEAFPKGVKNFVVKR
ncbi:MAG: TlpA family protein disulfide reductase, partial [Chitinophagaceae bacterium]